MPDRPLLKIWLVSDLHIELSRDWDLPAPAERPDFDVLVVAGDLMPKMDRGVRWLLARVPDRPIIFIAGNHEAYGHDVDKILDKAREAARGTSLIVLQNDAIEVAGVKFIGSTLWTDFALLGDAAAGMRAAAATMNDYKRIRHLNHSRRLRPIDTLLRHQQSRAFIERELLVPFSGPRIVVTHHAPYPGGLRNPAGAANDEVDADAPAYASDLTPLILATSPAAWLYGHTHRSDDSLLGATRMLSNAKGYGPGPGMPVWDNPMFDPVFTFAV